MARMTRVQTETRARLATIATLAVPPDQTAVLIAEALRQAIGWDGFRLFGIDPGTRLINRVLAASAEDHGARDEWLRDVYLRADRYGLGFIELDYLHRARLPAVAFADELERCFGYPAATLGAQSAREFRTAFVRNQAPVGGSLLANFTAGDRWVAAFQAYRRERGTSFRAGDVAFVRSVAPLIAETLAGALAREAASHVVTAGTDPVTGIVVLEASGRVRYASPAGEAWIDALRAGPGDATTVLPAAVWGTVAGLEASGVRAVNGVRVAGGAATIEATPGGTDGSVALVISPAPAPAQLRVPVAWGLTPAEERIATLVVQGYGNRTVAERLCVSENTVEWHLRRIFDRLDVQSRGQLTVRYFQEANLPRLTTNGIIPTPSVHRIQAHRSS